MPKSCKSPITSALWLPLCIQTSKQPNIHVRATQSAQSPSLRFVDLTELPYQLTRSLYGSMCCSLTLVTACTKSNIKIYLKSLNVQKISPFFANNQFDALFYSFIYYTSLHVSSIIVLIIRRSNCINTTSGMISLCEWLLGMPARKPAYQAVEIDVNQRSYSANMDPL